MPIAEKHASRPVDAGLQRVSLDLAPQLLPQRAVVAGAFLIQNDEVGPKTANAPIGVGQQHLTNQSDASQIGDRHSHHRQVPGDAVRPKARLMQVIPQQAFRRRTQGRVGVEQMTGKLLEAVRSGRPNAQVTEIQLGSGPGHFERAGHSVGPAILGYQGHQSIARRRGKRDERELETVAGFNGGAAAQAEYGIQDRSGGA